MYYYVTTWRYKDHTLGESLDTMLCIRADNITEAARRYCESEFDNGPNGLKHDFEMSHLVEIAVRTADIDSSWVKVRSEYEVRPTFTCTLP